MVHELLAFKASGGADLCKGSSHSRPLGDCSLVILPSGKQLFSPISPRLLLHLLFFSRWAMREGFLLFVSEGHAMTALQDPQLSCRYLSLRFFTFEYESTPTSSAINREKALYYTLLGLERSRNETLFTLSPSIIAIQLIIVSQALHALEYHLSVWSR